jgi:hypothetical protein
MSNTGADEEMPEASTSEESTTKAESTSKSSAAAKDYKSSAQLCEEMGIVNIEYTYTADDFANLVTYKLFNQHIRPLLLEKNPKLVMYKMVSVIGAKWREFIELKEKQQASGAGSGKEEASPSPAVEEEKKEPEETKGSTRRQTTRRRTGTQQETSSAAADEAAEAAAAAAIAEQADLDDQMTRRSSRNKRVCVEFRTV